MNFDVNWVAVLVAALASIVLGFIWYGPVFGKKWIALSGWTQAEMEANQKKGMGPTYVGMIIQSLLAAYILAAFIVTFGAITLSDGATLAFFIWLGFIATNTFGSILWDRMPVKLWTINNGYNLLNLVIQAAIIVQIA